MVSEKALFEAVLEYIAFGDVTRTIDEEDGKESTVYADISKRINDRKAYYRGCSDERKKELFLGHLIYFNDNDDFLPEKASGPQDIALNAADVSVDLYLGEIEVLGTPEEEVRSVMQKTIVKAKEYNEELGGGKKFLELYDRVTELEEQIGQLLPDK